MLNALRKWIWSEKKKKGFEEVFNSQEISSAINYRNSRFITGGEEGWSKYSYLSEILSENNTIKDLSKYNGKSIIGEIPQKIKEEINKLYSNAIKSVDLEESKDENDFICPTVKLVLAKDDPIKLRDFLDNDVSTNYNLDAVMLCGSDKDKTREVQLVIYEDESGNEIRSYRIINKTYNMNLTWYVEGKEISNDGSAKILERNGVTDEQICAYNEVMIGGKELKPSFLSEALGLQQTQGKSMEKIQPKLYKRSQPQKPTSKEDAKVEKNPEVESALKELASEVKEESSESVKPLTNVAKPDVKGAGSSIQR